MCSATQESFDSLVEYKADSTNSLQWTSPFVLPVWMKVWWQAFGTGFEPRLTAVRDGKIIGLSCLKVKDGVASFVGSDNVCDYIDFVVATGREDDFFNSLLDDLKRDNLLRLDLGLLRPDSLVLTKLADIARGRGGEVSIQKEDVSYEMDLPTTWEGYLETLNTKQRHEVRRKLRRLDEGGKVDYRLVKSDGADDSVMDTFMRLFPLAREDKAGFLTPEMESYFRLLARSLGNADLLRLGVMELDSHPVATIMCFDYNDVIYLYNSGYDPQYDSLSVGLLSKVLCIKQSVQERKRRFDFLKGNEVYKQRLGGKEIPLYRCQIAIK